MLRTATAISPFSRSLKYSCISFESSLWRATYDTRDGWTGINGGIGIVQSVAGMKDLWPYSGVNRFNDADMMCVGINGTGKSSSDLVLRPAGVSDVGSPVRSFLLRRTTLVS